jgi:hypothetical protein
MMALSDEPIIVTFAIAIAATVAFLATSALCIWLMLRENGRRVLIYASVALPALAACFYLCRWLCH